MINELPFQVNHLLSTLQLATKGLVLPTLINELVTTMSFVLRRVQCSRVLVLIMESLWLPQSKDRLLSYLKEARLLELVLLCSACSLLCSALSSGLSPPSVSHWFQALCICLSVDHLLNLQVKFRNSFTREEEEEEEKESFEEVFLRRL